MDLERDADTSRTLYISLLTRLKELQRQDQLARADASFVSRAPLAMSPSYPATKRILAVALLARSEEHTSELQSLMRISYAVFCLKKKKQRYTKPHDTYT